ncbi:MAG: hypothetical protein CVT49_05750 [candidate division Zixibacteria bacterium HGW-Zixibacteria-1]|nr:MAG: hypothetical protein CVT49_05750 [candidate division Zixibacteria bacterium HGW-Zixibacteria-1]
MERQNRDTRKTRPGLTYNIIINPKAADYSREKIDKLCKAITDAGGRYYLNEPDSPQSIVYHTKRIITKNPGGIIVCGGDGTINLVARHIIRRTIPLGIVPMGRFNNIYRSLYGEPDFKKAVDHILSGRDRKIDYGLASGEFFLGSVALGFIPQLHQLLQNRKPPRFAISWSRLAAQAAAMVEPKPFAIKVDAFAFDFTPQTFSINLLSHIAGIPIIPSCIPNDGKCEVVFDIGEGHAIMSSYLRQLFKRKYLYSDDVRLYRGERISVISVEGQKAYIDGEIVTLRAPELRVEVFAQKIRIFHKPDTVKK